MTPLTIWTNVELNSEQEVRLREAAVEHRLFCGTEASTKALADADVAFGQPPVDVVLDSPKLLWVQLSSAGYASYDRAEVREAFARRGGTLTKSSHVYADPCAQHVLAFMLAWARCLPDALEVHCDLRNGPVSHGTQRHWRHESMRQHSRLLTGQHVVLFGFGTIGDRLSQLLAPFAPVLTGIRRKPTGAERIETMSFDDRRVIDRLRAADHVINLLPHTPNTDRFFGRERFASCKPGAVFYNIGRGTTVDQDALLDALSSGHLAAALLDVTDPEPLPLQHPLWKMNNCFITPHTAGGHHNEGDRLLDHFLSNLTRFQNGQPLLDRAF